MNAQSGPDVAGLLGQHVLYPRVGGVSCHGCEWQSWEDGGTHEEHLDRLIREAYADWLESSKVREIAARASYEHPGPEGQARWSWDDKRVWNDTREVWRSDTGASLAALADLLRGQA